MAGASISQLPLRSPSVGSQTKTDRGRLERAPAGQLGFDPHEVAFSGGQAGGRDQRHGRRWSDPPRRRRPEAHQQDAVLQGLVGTPASAARSRACRAPRPRLGSTIRGSRGRPGAVANRAVWRSCDGSVSICESVVRMVRTSRGRRDLTELDDDRDTQDQGSRGGQRASGTGLGIQPNHPARVVRTASRRRLRHRRQLLVGVPDQEADLAETEGAIGEMAPRARCTRSVSSRAST